MDNNNNNNDFMSIFNDAHVDPNNIQNPDIPKQDNEIPQNVSNIISINQEQINQKILEQSEIIDNSTEIETNSLEPAIQKEEKVAEPVNYLSVLLFSLILGVLVFAGFNFAEKFLSKSKGNDNTKAMVDNIYNFEQSFSAYIVKKNVTSPINNTVACVSEEMGADWVNHPDFDTTLNCTDLINEYKQSDSAVEIPSYGVIYLNANGIKNGTHFVYDDYVCSYDGSVEKLFKCEKTE